MGECFFWYRPTRVVPDQRTLNGCVCACVTEHAVETDMSCMLDAVENGCYDVLAPDLSLALGAARARDMLLLKLQRHMDLSLSV